jgi:hypothetical protein
MPLFAALLVETMRGLSATELVIFDVFMAL